MQVSVNVVASAGATTSGTVVIDEWLEAGGLVKVMFCELADVAAPLVAPLVDVGVTVTVGLDVDCAPLIAVAFE